MWQLALSPSHVSHVQYEEILALKGVSRNMEDFGQDSLFSFLEASQQVPAASQAVSSLQALKASALGPDADVNTTRTPTSASSTPATPASTLHASPPATPRANEEARLAFRRRASSMTSVDLDASTIKRPPLFKSGSTTSNLEDGPQKNLSEMLDEVADAKTALGKEEPENAGKKGSHQAGVIFFCVCCITLQYVYVMLAGICLMI